MSKTEIIFCDTAGERPVTLLEESESPSARFGWHANPRSNVKQVLGWLSVLGLLLFIIGNQQGHIEVFYLILFAAVLSILLLRDLYLRKTSYFPVD